MHLQALLRISLTHPSEGIYQGIEMRLSLRELYNNITRGCVMYQFSTTIVRWH